MQCVFSKFEGAGNDFILLDDRSLSFPRENARLIAQLCVRQKGIGADGVILLDSSSRADFKMIVFNADGYRVAMCGNGLRCFVAFVRSLGATKNELLIETDAGLIAVRVQENQISISLPIPTLSYVEIELDGKLLALHTLNTGVPHAVIFVDDVDQVCVASYGRAIRFHSEFGPETLIAPSYYLYKSCTVLLLRFARHSGVFT